MSTQKSSLDDAAPYGIHPMFRKAAVLVPALKPKIQVSDRTVNAEAMVLGFIAEKSLPFNITPDLIGLAKELSRDQQALSELSMDRTTAAIKMRLGVMETNIDEATSNDSLCSGQPLLTP